MTHLDPDNLQIRLSASLKRFIQYALKLVYVPIYQLGMYRMFGNGNYSAVIDKKALSGFGRISKEIE